MLRRKKLKDNNVTRAVMMGNNKNGILRIEYLDIAKAMGMFLVLIGHTVASDTVVKNIIYSFHMPLFFIISGMVLKNSQSHGIKDWLHYITKKANTLLIPYFLWGLIYSQFSFKNLAFILYGTRETLAGANSLTSLWFLPVMFLSVLGTERVIAFAQKIEKEWALTIFCILFFVIGFVCPHIAKYGDPWGIDIAFISSGFMLIGYSLRKIIITHGQKTLFVLGVFIISTICFVHFVKYSTSSFGYVLMANAEYGNYGVFLLNAVLGSLLVISLSLLMEKVKIPKRAILFTGGNTQGIFVIHKPFVELGRSIAERVGLDYNMVLIAVIISLVSLVITVIIVYVIGRILPVAIGKKDKIQGVKS